MLTKFFITCNKVGFFTLGGGYAMIPIMEQEFVDKNHWLERQEFMDIMVVAQATPGIFSIDMASHIGYKLRGTWGGIVGALGIALPSIIASSSLPPSSTRLKTTPTLRGFSRRASRRGGAHRRALLQDGKTANINRYNFWIPIVSCALISLVGVSPIWIIIAAAVAGRLYGQYVKKNKD